MNELVKDRQMKASNHSQIKYRWIFGKWVETHAELTTEDAHRILVEARNQQKKLREVPFDLTLEVLDRARRVWSDRRSDCRVKVEELLRETTGFSPKMIELGLDELGEMLNPGVLKVKLETELRRIPVGVDYHWEPDSRRYLQYQPLGTLFHVLSGNVFLVGPGSWLEGILTQNVNILKLSSAETLFMPIFMESVQECDPEGFLAPFVALVDFPSSNREVLSAFQKSVDGVVVWGGEEAVKAYREGLPARTRLIQFGPKFSFGIVTRDALRNAGAETIAKDLAQELSIWDQNACTAPQVCFIQEAGSDLIDSRAFLCSLALALEEEEKKLRSGEADPDTAVEIRKWRAIAEIAEARGEGLLADAGENSLAWTAVLDGVRPLENSPLHRTLRLIPYRDPAEIADWVEPFRGYLQTVGIAASSAEFFSLYRLLSPWGVQRFLKLGQMAHGAVDDPHDGQYDLPQLLNLNFLRVPASLPESSLEFSWDILDSGERRKVQAQRLREVVRIAQQIPFYKARLGKMEIRNLEDLRKVPLLERVQWETEMPLAPANGGYVTRTGGSTGVPKYSYFDQRDWQAMVDCAVRVFKACGFRSSDRIANFMMVGDLYGSFISFNQVNYELGAQSFCFGATQDPKAFLEAAKKFRINVLQGVPPSLLSLVRKCKELDPGFTVEKIMFAGMPMSPADRLWLKNEVGVKHLSSLIGTTEANQVGYQCSFQEGQVHHLAEDYNYFEILDDDGGPAAVGQPGRLVVTGLQKKNYTILRYLIGDAVRELPGACPCGRLDKVIEYRGRWDDILCVGNMNLKLSDISDALGHLPFSAIQVIGSYIGKSEMILLKAEPLASLSPGEINSLKLQVTECLREKLHEFEKYLAKGSFEFAIEFVAPGALIRNPRTGKVKGIIDERQHVDSQE